MKNKVVVIAAALAVCISLSACGKRVDSITIHGNMLDIENLETSSICIENPVSIYEIWSENRQLRLFKDITDKELIETIKQNVTINDDTEIESCEWVDEEKDCFRIRVQYKEEPADHYRHKEDYFFFLDQDNIQVLYVDYPDKDYTNMEKGRYVWNFCDFNAHFEDVTFDGHNDLIIFLGHAGSHGTCIYGAYVYENGIYRYEQSFEDIPYYEIDTENQTIMGCNVNSASSSTSFVYKYRNGKFEEISYDTYISNGV